MHTHGLYIRYKGLSKQSQEIAEFEPNNIAELRNAMAPSVIARIFQKFRIVMRAHEA